MFPSIYQFDKDWIIGLGFVMAYRLCRETFSHKTLTLDNLEIRKAEDKKYLKKLFDHSANQPYPQRKTEKALCVYEQILTRCLKEGDKGWSEKTTD
tara:strand:+ start:362 stop:649 length:288 start_codon:yes stop_codon:yes gene_type:complete